MFGCNECTGDQVFANAELYLAHFQFYHNKLIASGNITCTYSNSCGRTYDMLNSFRKHVKSHKEVQTEFLHGFQCNHLPKWQWNVSVLLKRVTIVI